MARPSEGWKVRPDRRTGILYVRFTHAGRPEDISTGTRDPTKASTEAARIYAEVISGRWQRGITAIPKAGALINTPAAEWLVKRKPEVAKKTWDGYEIHLFTHLIPFFKSFDRVTKLSNDDYRRARLKVVKAPTVAKEMSTWRQFLEWCGEEGYIKEVPIVNGPKRGVLGVPDKKGKHKAKPTDLTEKDAYEIISRLPEFAERARKGPNKHRVRDAFVVLWETGLRPITVARLRVPEHFRPNATHLTITADIDKVRFARSLPLTMKAREALQRSAPDIGLIFGERDYRIPLKKAAEAAYKAKKLTRFQAETVSPYDFRHGRTTELAQSTANLAGVSFLAGHRHISTTSRYVHAPQRAAESVLSEDNQRRKRAAKRTKKNPG